MPLQRLVHRRPAQLALGVAIALVAFALPAATFNEPDGFGKAKFGMKEAELKAAYPKAEAVARPTPNPAVQQPWFPLQAYRLEGQTVGPLKNCRLEFRLFDGELYDIQFLCPEKDQIFKYLQYQFGPTTKTSGSALFWIGTHAAISYVPKSGAFSFQDAVRAQRVQGVMLRAMSKGQQPAQTPTAASAPPERKAE